MHHLREMQKYFPIDNPSFRILDYFTHRKYKKLQYSNYVFPTYVFHPSNTLKVCQINFENNKDQLSITKLIV